MRSLELTLRSVQEKKWRSPLFFFFVVPSFCYFLGSYFHKFLYKIGILSKKKVPAVVISVGNIVVGGSGKTPVVQMIANRLPSPAIVTRLLGKKRTGEPVRVTSKMPPHDVGDEPLLHLQRCPNAKVFAARRKVEAAEMASKMCAYILVDDAFQHYALYKDIEIVCIPAVNPLGNGFLLPAGMLREPVKALSRADYIVFTSAQHCTGALKDAVSKYTKAPQIGVTYVASDDALFFKTGSAFCGIGNPESFFSLLEEKGVQLIRRHVYQDHGFLSKALVEGFISEAKGDGAQALYCTEKDFIKLPPDLQCNPFIQCVKIDSRIIFGEDSFNDLLVKIQNK